MHENVLNQLYYGFAENALAHARALWHRTCAQSRSCIMASYMRTITLVHYGIVHAHNPYN